MGFRQESPCTLCSRWSNTRRHQSTVLVGEGQWPVLEPFDCLICVGTPRHRIDREITRDWSIRQPYTQRWPTPFDQVISRLKIIESATVLDTWTQLDDWNFESASRTKFIHGETYTEVQLHCLVDTNRIHYNSGMQFILVRLHQLVQPSILVLIARKFSEHSLVKEAISFTALIQ